jgi:Flp pilus assembly protein TadB
MTMDENSPPRDHVAADEDSVERHLKSKSTWLRLLFMLVFLLLYGVSRVVVVAVVIIQFFWLLFTGTTNEDLRKLGQSLATYTYQIVRYLTFNTEERPFPFDQDWPSPEPPDFRAQ